MLLGVRDPAGAQAHAAEQRDPRPCGGVRRGRAKGRADQIEPRLRPAWRRTMTMPPLAKRAVRPASRGLRAAQGAARTGRGPAAGLASSDTRPAERLAQIPGIGPIGTAALLAIESLPDPGGVRIRARLRGLDRAHVPEDHSTAGKVRHGAITKAGDEGLRSAAGARRHIGDPAGERSRGAASPWLVELLRRKPARLVAVALANKMARVAWKLMVSGEDDAPHGSRAAAVARDH